jgi:hypothetical protein
VFLCISAVVLDAAAYALYLFQISAGGSTPNPASWTVWFFLATLSAITFWKGSKDAVGSAQFFVSALGCCVIWGFAWYRGKFTPLDPMGWAILVFCVATCVFWRIKKNAMYANLIVASALLLSSCPTIVGAWQRKGIEGPLAWYVWTAAFLVTSVNVFRRADRSKARWGLVMVTPILGIVIHGTVALGAALW